MVSWQNVDMIRADVAEKTSSSQSVAVADIKVSHVVKDCADSRLSWRLDIRHRRRG